MLSSAASGIAAGAKGKWPMTATRLPATRGAYGWKVRAQLFSLQGRNPWARARTGWEWYALTAAMPTPASSKFQDFARAATSRRGRPTRSEGSSSARGRDWTFMPKAMPAPSSLVATRRHLPSVWIAVTVMSAGISSMSWSYRSQGLVMVSPVGSVREGPAQRRTLHMLGHPKTTRRCPSGCDGAPIRPRRPRRGRGTRGR